VATAVAGICLELKGTSPAASLQRERIAVSLPQENIDVASSPDVVWRMGAVVKADGIRADRRGLQSVSGSCRPWWLGPYGDALWERNCMWGT